MTELSTIKIPKTVYVGFQGRRTQDEVPLGFMTPYEDNAAGQKRRDSVDNWAKGHSYYGGASQKTFNSVIMENEPMIGFKIGRAIRRTGGWNGSGASYVRIEDPRGFELEITIENLVMCMGDTIIHDGELAQECVWGRDGGRNILLPTNSEPYRHSLDTAERVAAVLSLKDVKPGDEITLLTGEKGLYLGGMYALSRTQESDYENDRTVTSLAVDSKKRYVLREVGEDGKFQFIGRAQIKVASIDKPAATKMSPKEIEQLIADEIKARRKASICSNNSGGSDYYNQMKGWLCSPKGATQTSVWESLDEAKAKRAYNSDHYTALVVFAKDGTQILSDNYQNLHIDRHTKDRTYTRSTPGASSWAYNRTEYVKTTAFLGTTILKQDVASLTSRRGETRLIEEVDFDHYERLLVTTTSATGVVFTAHM